MADGYADLLKKIETLSMKHHMYDDFTNAVVKLLQETVPHYSWVGIYMVEGSDLVLCAWKGPAATEHTRIPIGKGVCGAAAASGKTEVVDDVSKDPRYLACFRSTKSEIVVPIIPPRKTNIVGEIDIDSDLPAAFTPADRRFLEAVAAILGDKLG
ncbi:MAG: GAF domain-containing protein [bacterium]